MALIQAAILGVIQGITEFLPVSSSGHLILVREVFGWQLLDDTHWNTIFDVSVHAGTFVALLVYFRSDIGRLASAFFVVPRRGDAPVPERRLAWIIVVATIPAALVGILGEEVVEAHLREGPMIVAGLLIIFGVILWVAEARGRKATGLDELRWSDGILIGLVQGLALAPGVSRSGITITMGLARGMKRETAARFSFLLSIPIIGGAAAYGLQSVVRDFGALPEGSGPIFAVGFVAAAVSGYLCIRYFLHYLQTRSLVPFIIYRLRVGAVLLVWFASLLE